MKETGFILRNAREKQNVSLAAVSAVTKINIKFLEAIEKADGPNLPSKTFLRGFVQTYANFLKLDQNFVMETFHKEMGTTRYAPVITDPSALAEGADGLGVAANVNAVATENLVAKSENVGSVGLRAEDTGLAAANGQKSALSKVFFGGVALILLVSIYVVFQLVQKYQKESQVPTPPAEIHTNALPPSTVTPTPTDAAADVKTVEDKPAEPAKADEKPEAPKVTEPAVAAAKPIETAPKPETPVPTVAKPVETPKPVEAVKLTPQEVVIEALDAVKIDFRIDGGTLQSMTLQPEERRTLKAKKNINIDVSDGGAVNVNYNGKDRGVPGNLGQAIKLSFP